MKACFSKLSCTQRLFGTTPKSAGELMATNVCSAALGSDMVLSFSRNAGILQTRLVPGICKKYCFAAYSCITLKNLNAFLESRDALLSATPDQASQVDRSPIHYWTRCESNLPPCRAQSGINLGARCGSAQLMVGSRQQQLLAKHASKVKKTTLSRSLVGQQYIGESLRAEIGVCSIYQIKIQSELPA